MLLDKTPRTLIGELYETDKALRSAHNQVVLMILHNGNFGPAFEQAEQERNQHLERFKGIKSQIMEHE